MREVFYPPVGMAHITADLADLVRDRMTGMGAIQLSCSMQPNSSPHLGSVITMTTAFAIGHHLSQRFNIPAAVTFDVLENAPIESITVDGLEYTRNTAQVIRDGKPHSSTFTEPMTALMRFLGTASEVSWNTRLYNELQAHPRFRADLIKILLRQSEFLPVLAPSDGALRVRFPCPVCGFVEKACRTIRVEALNEYQAVLSALCCTHGRHEITLSPDTTTFVDTNTPVRSVLKAATMIADSTAMGLLPIIVNGSDWAGMWVQRIYCEALCLLGYSMKQIPLYMFAPLIEDWSGAKLSKTIYLRAGAYADIDRELVDFEAFRTRFGDKGLMLIWNEVRGWVDDPKRYFRNYSVEYIRQLFETLS